MGLERALSCLSSQAGCDCSLIRDKYFTWGQPLPFPTPAEALSATALCLPLHVGSTTANAESTALAKATVNPNNRSICAMLSGTQCDFLGCPVQGQELDSRTLVAPFQLRKFYDSIIIPVTSSGICGPPRLINLFQSVIKIKIIDKDCRPSPKFLYLWMGKTMIQHQRTKVWWNWNPTSKPLQTSRH